AGPSGDISLDTDERMAAHDTRGRALVQRRGPHCAPSFIRGPGRPAGPLEIPRELDQVERAQVVNAVATDHPPGCGRDAPWLREAPGHPDRGDGVVVPQHPVVL